MWIQYLTYPSTGGAVDSAAPAAETHWEKAFNEYDELHTKLCPFDDFEVCKKYTSQK